MIVGEQKAHNILPFTDDAIILGHGAAVPIRRRSRSI